MRVFDETKTTELSEYDLEKGRLMVDRLLVAHHDAVEAVAEQGHHEVTATYPNGGKDVEWVVDVPGVDAKPAWDEYEEIRVYVPYTEKELAEIEIRELKAKLASTDYKAIKYAEGVLSAEEYADTKAQREEWRERINELETVTEG